ncbi:protein kinase domain-containing protein [Blastococcus sp. SYSU D00820]
MPLAPGDVFAGYTVERLLGEGGMGAVYLARHPRLPRSDALKVLRPELSAEPDHTRRFLREADLVAGLAHRNIVPVLDRGEDRGRLWLAMPYIEGIDAEEALAAAGGLMPAERVVHIVTEVAAALDSAHRRNMVHRDVKPANVLLAREDADEPEQVFLTDFGIAKSLDGGTRITRTGAVLATFEYASPEQIESRPLDGRSDVYSLGCVLYRLLTGSVPFGGASVAAALHGHLSLPPPRPTAVVPWLPPRLDDVVARAMAKDPAERYPTARALAADAAAALTDLPPAPPLPYRITVARRARGGPAVTGPVHTDRLPADDAQCIAALVRRTRFFDLPGSLLDPPPSVARAGRTGAAQHVTVEVAGGGRSARVVADLASAFCPPDLPGLLATVEAAAGAPGAGGEPTTVVRPAAGPPTGPRTGPRPPSTGPHPPPSTGPRPAPVPGPPAGATPPAPAALPAHPPPLPRLPATPPPWQHPIPPRGAVRDAGVRDAGVRDAGPPPAARTGPPPPPGPARPQRRRRWPALLAVVLLLAAGALIWLLTRGDDPGRAPSGDAGGTDAEQALAALPRGPALPAGTLVVPHQVDPSSSYLETAVDLWLVDADTGAVGTRLTDSGRALHPVISPDRRSVVYWYGDGQTAELRVVGTDGSGDRPLFDPAPADCPQPQRPAWNVSDPTQLALACSGPDGASLRVVGLDGATVRDLDPGVPFLADVAFSPDGTEVAYWGNDDPGVDGGALYAVAADGGSAPRRLTDSASDADPVWSPDGTQLAFRRVVAPGEAVVVVMAADGSGEREVTSGGYDQDPAWSPGGDALAVKRSLPTDDGVSHVWVMGPDGAHPRQLPDPEDVTIHAPAWGPR